MMNIHGAHHIYNIALRRKCFWKHFFLREISIPKQLQLDIHYTHGILGGLFLMCSFFMHITANWIWPWYGAPSVGILNSWPVFGQNFCQNSIFQIRRKENDTIGMCYRCHHSGLAKNTFPISCIVYCSYVEKLYNFLRKSNFLIFLQWDFQKFFRSQKLEAKIGIPNLGNTQPRMDLWVHPCNVTPVQVGAKFRIILGV